MEVLKVAGVDVVAVHVPEAQTSEQALVADLIALVTSFAGKIHRRRQGRNAVAPAGEAPVAAIAPPAIEH